MEQHLCDINGERLYSDFMKDEYIRSEIEEINDIFKDELNLNFQIRPYFCVSNKFGMEVIIKDEKIDENKMVIEMENIFREKKNIFYCLKILINKNLIIIYK